MKRAIVERILKKLWWIDGRTLENVVISIIDRTGNVKNIKDIRLSKDSKVLRDRIIIDDTVIPTHRVIAIKHKGVVIWRKNSA